MVHLRAMLERYRIKPRIAQPYYKYNHAGTLLRICHPGNAQIRRKLFHGYELRLSPSTTAPATHSALRQQTMSTPKRVSEMTAEERLASLRAWAEEQKYITPGTCGSLSAYGRIYTNTVEAYQGPVRIVTHQYSPPLAPPSYETALAETAKKKTRAGLIKRLLQKRKVKKDDSNEVQRR
jgi:hypothetical protein